MVRLGRRWVPRRNNPFLDFVGVWTETGRAVFIEAKYTEDEYLRVDGRGGGVDDRQMANLRLWDKAGADAMVIWRSRLGTLVMDVAFLNQVYGKFKRKYVSYTEASTNWLCTSVRGLLFLEAMQRLYGI